MSRESEKGAQKWKAAYSEHTYRRTSKSLALKTDAHELAVLVRSEVNAIAVPTLCAFCCRDAAHVHELAVVFLYADVQLVAVTVQISPEVKHGALHVADVNLRRFAAHRLANCCC